MMLYLYVRLMFGKVYTFSLEELFDFQRAVTMCLCSDFVRLNEKACAKVSYIAGFTLGFIESKLQNAGAFEADKKGLVS